MMIHDYNSNVYRGIKAALDKFSSETGVVFVPLCDVCGSAIVVRQ
jgi:O-methyltransferase